MITTLPLKNLPTESLPVFFVLISFAYTYALNCDALTGLTDLMIHAVT